LPQIERDGEREREREILRDPGPNPLLLGFCCMVLPQIERGRERERDPGESNFIFSCRSLVKQKGNRVDPLQDQVVEGLGQLPGV
jgi:hypothetical protein